MNKTLFALLGIILLFSYSCIEKVDSEEEQSIFKINSPNPCDTLYFGEAFLLHIDFYDSSGLGNLYMDLHNNFGHHSHGEHEACFMDEVKDPLHPYYNDWLFSLPENQTRYTFDTLITLEKSKVVGVDSIPWDEGDYHFHMYITDADGNQVFTSQDVKIMN